MGVCRQDGNGGGTESKEGGGADELVHSNLLEGRRAERVQYSQRHGRDGELVGQEDDEEGVVAHVAVAVHHILLDADISSD